MICGIGNSAESVTDTGCRMGALYEVLSVGLRANVDEIRRSRAGERQTLLVLDDYGKCSAVTHTPSHGHVHWRPRLTHSCATASHWLTADCQATNKTAACSVSIIIEHH